MSNPTEIPSHTILSPYLAAPFTERTTPELRVSAVTDYGRQLRIAERAGWSALANSEEQDDQLPDTLKLATALACEPTLLSIADGSSAHSHATTDNVLEGFGQISEKVMRLNLLKNPTASQLAAHAELVGVGLLAWYNRTHSAEGGWVIPVATPQAEVGAVVADTPHARLRTAKGTRHRISFSAGHDAASDRPVSGSIVININRLTTVTDSRQAITEVYRALSLLSTGKSRVLGNMIPALHAGLDGRSKKAA